MQAESAYSNSPGELVAQTNEEIEAVLAGEFGRESQYVLSARDALGGRVPLGGFSLSDYSTNKLLGMDDSALKSSDMEAIAMATQSKPQVAGHLQNSMSFSQICDGGGGGAEQALQDGQNSASNQKFSDTNYGEKEIGNESNIQKLGQNSQISNDKVEQQQQEEILQASLMFESQQNLSSMVIGSNSSSKINENNASAHIKAQKNSSPGGQAQGSATNLSDLNTQMNNIIIQAQTFDELSHLIQARKGVEVVPLFTPIKKSSSKNSRVCTENSGEEKQQQSSRSRGQHKAMQNVQKPASQKVVKDIVEDSIKAGSQQQLARYSPVQHTQLSAQSMAQQDQQGRQQSAEKGVQMPESDAIVVKSYRVGVRASRMNEQGAENVSPNSQDLVRTITDFERSRSVKKVLDGNSQSQKIICESESRAENNSPLQPNILCLEEETYHQSSAEKATLIISKNICSNFGAQQADGAAKNKEPRAYHFGKQELDRRLEERQEQHLQNVVTYDTLLAAQQQQQEGKKRGGKSINQKDKNQQQHLNVQLTKEQKKMLLERERQAKRSASRETNTKNQQLEKSSSRDALKSQEAQQPKVVKKESKNVTSRYQNKKDNSMSNLSIDLTAQESTNAQLVTNKEKRREGKVRVSEKQSHIITTQSQPLSSERSPAEEVQSLHEQLYQKGVAQLRERELKHQEQLRQSEERERVGCTFRPNISARAQNLQGVGIVAKTEQYLKQQQQSQEDTQQQFAQTRDARECTFKPDLRLTKNYRSKSPHLNSSINSTDIGQHTLHSTRSLKQSNQVLQQQGSLTQISRKQRHKRCSSQSSNSQQNNYTTAPEVPARWLVADSSFSPSSLINSNKATLVSSQESSVMQPDGRSKIQTYLNKFLKSLNYANPPEKAEDFRQQAANALRAAQPRVANVINSTTIVHAPRGDDSKNQKKSKNIELQNEIERTFELFSKIKDKIKHRGEKLITLDIDCPQPSSKNSGSYYYQQSRGGGAVQIKNQANKESNLLSDKYNTGRHLGEVCIRDGKYEIVFQKDSDSDRKNSPPHNKHVRATPIEQISSIKKVVQCDERHPVSDFEKNLTIIELQRKYSSLLKHALNIKKNLDTVKKQNDIIAAEARQKIQESCEKGIAVAQIRRCGRDEPIKPYR